MKNGINPGIVKNGARRSVWRPHEVTQDGCLAEKPQRNITIAHRAINTKNPTSGRAQTSSPVRKKLQASVRRFSVHRNLMAVRSTR